MLKFLAYQYGRRLYSADLDHNAARLLVTGAFNLALPFAVADIRARYGDGALLVYVARSAADASLSVGVYAKEEGGRLSPERRTYLQSLTDADDLLLMADLPAGAQAWTDPGVRIVCLYTFDDYTDPSHRIKLWTNEGADHTAAVDYLQDTPLRYSWVVLKERFDAEAV